MEGEWKKSNMDKKDKKVRHSGRASGLPYDSWETAHWIKIFDIIGEPFQLLANNRLPEAVVEQIVIWERRQARKKKTKTWVTTDDWGRNDPPHTRSKKGGDVHLKTHRSNTEHEKKS